MRRLSAIVLLAWFGLAVIAPALRADTGSKLPACCRRDGRHHCAVPASAGTAIQAVCAEYPRTGATPAHSKTVLLRPAVSAPAPLLKISARGAAHESLARAGFHGTHTGRAPPPLLS